MIILLIDKNNSTSWREVKAVEVTEHYLTFLDDGQVKAVEVTEHYLTFLDDGHFFTLQYEDIRYAELLLPNGGKAVLYRDETGGN